MYFIWEFVLFFSTALWSSSREEAVLRSDMDDEARGKTRCLPSTNPSGVMTDMKMMALDISGSLDAHCALLCSTQNDASCIS